MSLTSADQVVLRSGDEVIAGITRRRLTLSQAVTDVTGAVESRWAIKAITDKPAEADLLAEGVFIANTAADVLRSAFLDGEAIGLELVIPHTGQWSGDFYVRQLTMTGKAEGELNFSTRLASTGSVVFTPEMEE